MPITILGRLRLPSIVSLKIPSAKVSCDKWELKDHHRICSDHFVSGKPSKDRDNVDYVPTVFNDGKKRLVVRSNPERADRAAKRRKHVDEVNEVVSILVDFH